MIKSVIGMNNDQIELIFGTNAKLLCGRIFSFHHRFPNLFPLSVATEMAAFLLNLPRYFLDKCSLIILCKIFFSYYRLHKQVQDSSSNRINIKILTINPSVYGIAIVLGPLQEFEIFNESHIIKSVQSLIPGVRPVPHSYFSYHPKKDRFFYIEIKKIRGGYFSSDERENLISNLPHEIEKRIDHISPSLIVPGNEEMLIKNIQKLSKEIKSSGDPPQLMISFTEYSQKILKFVVIVARIVKEGSPSIHSLGQHLPPDVRLSIENVFYVHKRRKQAQKEVAIIAIEIKSAIFLGNNNTVNLRTARQYVFRIFEGYFGSCRDYYGGLLSKEDEQLAEIKELLEKENFSMIPLFEELFYGVRPILSRALISSKTGVAIAAIFKDIVKQPLGKAEKFCIKSQSSSEADIVIIKARDKWEKSFPQAICKYSPQIGYSSLNHDGHLYLCFFHQLPQTSILLQAIQRELTQNIFVNTSQQKSVLRLNYQGGDPASLNPRLATDMQSHILSNLLFEGLTRMTSEGVVEPAAAEKIEVSPDGMLYTFHLRPTYWSNGEQLTASHFEQAWKKAITSQSGLTRSDLFSPIKNVSRFFHQKGTLDEIGIIVKNKKTLCVQLEFPCSYFLNLVGTPHFFPMLGNAQEPTQFNGPYVASEWKQGSYLLLSNNPFYWNLSQIKLSGIKITMVRDAKVAYEMFQNGELDLIGDPISPLLIDQLKCPTIIDRLVSKDIQRIFWIHCNMASYPLNNTSLRQALNWAINRKKIVEKIFYHQTPCISPLPTKYSRVDADVEGNAVLAREYFEKALQELNIERSAFPALVFNHSDLSFEKPLMEELVEQWRNVLGIEVIPKEMPWSEFFAMLEKGAYQLTGLFKRDFIHHPMSYLSCFIKSPHNPQSWENPEFNALIEQYKREEAGLIPHESKLPVSNRVYSNESLRNIELLLIQQAPIIPLVNQKYFALINQRVSGIDWNLDGCLNLTKVLINENDF